MIDLLHAAKERKAGGFAAEFRPVVEAWVVSSRPWWRCRIGRELERQGIHWKGFGPMHGNELSVEAGKPDVVITDGSAGILDFLSASGCEVIVAWP